MWGYVSAEDKAQCELALLKYLNKKLDRAAHRNTFDRKFLEYRGDVLGATIHDMVERGSSSRSSTGGTSLVKAAC